MSYQITIISGMWKGRTIVLPADESVRPSKNMVRQAVFNLLGSRVDLMGLTVADLCCGSGALGLEAASRGAGRVLLVDKDTKVAAVNVAGLGSPAQVEVLTANVARWEAPAPLDVIMADPPYGSPLAEALLARRDSLGQPGSWWVMEIAAETTLPDAGFTDVAVRDYGKSRVWLGRQA